MKLLPLLFGYIFQGNQGKWAGPIIQTDICINECTGVSDDWTNYSNMGIKVDGNVQFLGNPLIMGIYNNFIMHMKCSISQGDLELTLILVDISHCGLTKVSRVITWMTCDTRCWYAMGSDKIYNLTNNSFRVYLNQPIEWVDGNAQTPSSPLRANEVKNWNWELHYEVKGICNGIPGSG